jgi:Flp pilus assembly protein CpaB
MKAERENDGAESSSQPARTRTLDSRPSQLDAEHAAAPAGPLDVTQRPAVHQDEGRAAAHRATSSTVDTVTGEGLRSASPALAPPLAY